MRLPWGIALVVTSCIPGKEAPPHEADPQITVPQNMCSDALAVSLFCETVKVQPGNVVISPAGAEAVLRMLQQGARGEVAAELAALPMGAADVPTTMQPTAASAVFVDDSLRLNSGISAGGVIKAPLSTAPAQAVAQINAWAGAHTRGLVPELLGADALSQQGPTRMVLANAMVLQEKWLRPFSPDKTSRAPFRCSDGTVVTADMMQRQSDFRYAEGVDWQAVALFYRTDGRKGNPGCFMAILPKGDARAFATELTPEKYTAIRRALAKADPQEMVVALPKFTVNPPALSLRKPLQACGAKLLFCYTADWGGFTDEELRVQDLVQRCYVQVDEQGTRAAAATAALMMQRCLPMEMTFNRPFLWVITDLTTPAAPYFMGLVERP